MEHLGRLLDGTGREEVIVLREPCDGLVHDGVAYTSTGPVEVLTPKLTLQDYRA